MPATHYCKQAWETDGRSAAQVKTSPEFSDTKARLTEEIRVEAMKAAEMV
jgi:hypothetical protein